MIYMSMNIKNAEAENLVRELAAETGESLTRAMMVAVRERLDRVRNQEDATTAERIEALHRLSADAAPRWVEPYRGTDHGDLLYDDEGLPR